jgi:hypothetical protein
LLRHKFLKRHFPGARCIRCGLGEVDFWIFWIFNFLHFAVDGKNNSKTKVEKVFFFIFMSSYAEMSFLKQKITK